MSTIVDPAMKTKLKNAMTEASSAMSRIETERETIKDIINTISAEQSIEKPVLRKLFKAYHKQNFAEEVATSEEFQNIYSSVVG